LDKKKILIITLILAVVLVMIFFTVPQILERQRQKAALKEAVAAASTSKSTDEAGKGSKSEKSVKSEGESKSSKEVSGSAYASTEGEGETGAKKDSSESAWMNSFITSNRTWGRSPFLRIGEGMGKILILSSPSSADIFIDGVKMPEKTNWITPLTLPPKKYLLEIKKEGYYPHVQDLVVTAGVEEFRDINTINVTLEKIPVNAEEVAGEIWRQLKRPALYVSMIVYDDQKPSALITEYNPDAPPPVGDPLSNRVVFEGDTFSLPGSEAESKRVFLVKSINRDNVVIEDTLVNWDYILEVYKEAK
jgi:hypothetical protein